MLSKIYIYFISVYLFITLFSSVVCAEKIEEEIRVHLPTISQLQPIYLGKIFSQKAVFDVHYLNQLEAILCYDLDYNGSTKVCQRTSDKEQLLRNKDLTAAFQIQNWQKFGIPYILKCCVNQKQLTLYLFNVSKSCLKTFGPILLSGNLSQDRKKIHKLADALHKALFSIEGVASTRILFSQKIPHNESGKWISEIWECDWDGANACQVTSEKTYCISPVLLPKRENSSKEGFFFVSYKTGQPKIYFQASKTDKAKRVSHLRGNQLLPAVSSQRNKIAFISDASGRVDLFLQAFSPETGKMEKPIQIYSHPHAVQASPAFSPDGSKIAFASNKDGGTRIFIISINSDKKRPPAVMITKKNRENSCPSWSSDGTKLAYSAKTNGIRQIWIYDFEKNEEWQLTSGPGNKENPFWAPNSNHIIFNSTQDCNSEIYVVNLNQPQVIKISRGLGKKHYPNWGL
ncbi:Tol-Pal system protein TolB [Candidatus Rhabdochlamydia oedothoracis]|uniref:Protein TolB homolog n=1 Tax=Candidatus Rhabdochlamydia oedothoracis TaxID=2720720 RepID=A0ABX8UYV6_9BACT|nr:MULTISPECIES: Tol-Pal system protein TolB [Rhabdochlamydia]KAG6558952.1 Protein TolB [Candidatus Rhabdochlamydia sp. W815]MCL6755790.1 Tol-Pal system protein TolB [Candidatus Rhabdochlamydia oedothoracis]QYF48137.1 Tol-Pal system protein TolB [Candidatus Rhabdochlamydia oedothoracis]